MGGGINDLITGLIETVLNTLTSATQAALNWVLGLLAASVFSSPDVTALPQVSYVSGRAQLVGGGHLHQPGVLWGPNHNRQGR